MGEAQLPWTFCYPAGWRYRERLQPSSTPDGFDATFDITDTTPGDGLGKFGFMLIGTYDAGSAADLSSWARSNLGSTDLSPARWGDAREAARLPNGDRLALTAHSVVRLTLRSGAGNLDLEAAMGSRLNTWHFAY